MSCEKDERDINEVDDDDDVQIRANYAKKTQHIDDNNNFGPPLQCRSSSAEHNYIYRKSIHILM